MKFYKLSEDLRSRVLDYMRGRPYKEVATGIMELSQLHEIDATAAQNKDVKK